MRQALLFQDHLARLEVNVIIVQRTPSRFFRTLFRNKIDLSNGRPTVIFAGEPAADAGGPWRELLRLCMNFIANEPTLMFGSSNQSLFVASPDVVQSKHYYIMGQIAAASILTIGRGPECFHPALVDTLFGKPIKNSVAFEDATFDAIIKEIDSGNLDALLDANIGASDLKLGKELFAKHYAIYSRFSAISSFKDGVNSVAPCILNSYKIYVRYFLDKCGDQVTFLELLLQLNYIRSDLGSSKRAMQDEVVFEFECLLNDIEEKPCGDVNLSNFLIFVTCMDRVPPYGFPTPIEVIFKEKDELATASTCGLGFYLPTINTRKDVYLALKSTTKKYIDFIHLKKLLSWILLQIFRYLLFIYGTFLP